MKTSFADNFETACLESFNDLATAKLQNNPEQEAKEAETEAVRKKLLQALNGRTI